MPSPATEGERGWEGTLNGERVERRLTALLAADVAGYSRLMGADAEGTLAAPKSDPARVGRSVDRRALRPAMSRRPRRPMCRRCRQVPRALDPEKAEPGRGGGDRNRRYLALRRAWNDEHASALLKNGFMHKNRTSCSRTVGRRIAGEGQRVTTLPCGI